MTEDYQKALKKLNLFFILNPVPFNGQSYKRQKRSGTSHQSLCRSQNKFRKIALFVIYCLTKFDDVNVKQFLSIPKITSANLGKSVYDIINYPTSICPFESGKFGKEGKKHKNLNILRMKRAFLMK